MSEFILDWPAAAAAGPSKAGGKGWQLALLAELGLPVPPGFVISASAAACGRNEPLPASLLTELSNELARRGWKEQPLAVRSSAYAEDSTRASFAGIHHSSLNVRGADAVGAAVQAVRDSRWTPAAEAYRQRPARYPSSSSWAAANPPMPRLALGPVFPHALRGYPGDRPRDTEARGRRCDLASHVGPEVNFRRAPTAMTASVTPLMNFGETSTPCCGAHLACGGRGARSGAVRVRKAAPRDTA